MQQHHLTTKTLADYLLSASVIRDAAYIAMWNRGRIKYSDNQVVPDLIDELNTRLSTSTIVNQEKTLIVFPDRQEKRGSLLFSTTIVLDFLRQRQTNQILKPILYFGATVGIRQHLSSVYINKLSLGSVFPQSNVGRADKRPRSNGYASDIKLPTVITIYSPSDPVTLCEQYKPDWIAVDCSDKNQLTWVEPLLAHARERALPVIAWMTNPLSSLIHVFERHSSSIIYWPQIDNVPCRDIPLIDALGEIFTPPPPIDVQPIILEVESKNPYWENLLQAYRQLSHLTKDVNRSGSSLRLARITIGLAWRTLRTLEGMIVPLELYETESKNMWGVNSISDSLQTMKSYLSNLQTLSTTTQDEFQTVYDALQSVHQYLQKQTPPLWAALIDVCLEETNQRRTLVFATNSARDLFSLALSPCARMSETTSPKRLV